MKYTNRILLSDMDGTLLDSNSRVSSKNKEAIKFFVNNGGKFGIATGRSQLNSVNFLDEVPISAPCILYNGGALYDFTANNFIALNLLPERVLINFLQYCIREVQNVMVQIYSTDMCYFVSKEALADPEVVAGHQPGQFIQIEDIIHEPWIKILFSGSEKDLKLVEKMMFQFDIADKVSRVFTSDIYLEILPLGVSKGSMLKNLKKTIGDDYKIYAVGDYNNDIEMIQLADVGIATENALSCLKDMADHISASNDEDAIADIIYRIMNE
ncbi:hypothetical protein EDD66_102180 [Mobilisporobacter senegalensis]|uniref:Cof subfamily protein (Haloacid dehalogenase superfamily)/HAD superfamily hydrolase (TIGR01484 family) n=1 Tax=Mobilisporobacter senegalensis TaxID=1329262 RepID=A0A3N1XW74_9FIRM|nr:Cof-type HAD-IIB family hydrolase [Mobilisporobacter senegalensis]ROR30528.1 hypothetical protein EDD66_102180 [Mobilisporobacter senegalensis]